MEMNTVNTENINARIAIVIDFHGRWMPDWEGSLNEIVKLCSTTTRRWSLVTNNSAGRQFQAIVAESFSGPEHEVIAETPAKALCLAWLAAMERN